MSKPTVTIELLDSDKIYEGRLLGLVDDKQFHALMTKKSFQNKVFSGATVTVKEIQDNYGNKGFKGMRLVLAIREVNGESKVGKHLFITERLSFISNEDKGEIGILGEGDTLYTVSES